MYNEHISLAALTPHEALVGFGLLHTVHKNPYSMTAIHLEIAGDILLVNRLALVISHHLQPRGIPFKNHSIERAFVLSTPLEYSQALWSICVVLILTSGLKHKRS